MSKNIILLSDGTGNSSSKLFKTNVFRMYQALDLTDPARQQAYYDDGVGTSSFKPLAILGGVFGVGLKRNVLDIYSFCCRNYRTGDKLYGFGFSRGAFTIRVVAGFIARIGLVRYDGNEAHLARDAEIAYREYRKARNFRSGGNYLDRSAAGAARLGQSCHLPQADALTSSTGSDREIRLSRRLGYGWGLWRPDRRDHPGDRLLVLAAVDAGPVHESQDWPGVPCAGAGGGARSFRPVLWDDRYVRDGDRLYPADHGWQPATSQHGKPLADIDRERISQVWFVDVHSDVGGGYSRDGLSYCTLTWMMERAGIYGLQYLPVQQSLLSGFVDPVRQAQQFTAWAFRLLPISAAQAGRDLLRAALQAVAGAGLSTHPRHPEQPAGSRARSQGRTCRSTLLSGAARRKLIKLCSTGYAWETMATARSCCRKNYDIVGYNGSVTANTAVAEPTAAARAIRQESVWDWVWARRVAYFATVSPCSIWWRCR